MKGRLMIMHKWKKYVPAIMAVIAAGTLTAHIAYAQNDGDSSIGTETSVSTESQTQGTPPDGTPPAGGPGGSTSGSAVNGQPGGTPPDGTPPAGGPGGNASGSAISGAPGGGNGAPGGSSSRVTSYSAVKSITSDTTLSGETIASTGTDENAINISGGAIVNMNKMVISRTSSDSTGGDNSSFYGVGAAVLNTKGTTVISDSTITTDAKGGAGVFSYGDGVTYVSDTTISTKQDTSGGIHAAGGGTLYAWDVTATTEGESSAAIRSDRGGGKMVADGGTYTSKGTGSPAIYSTADIAVNNATLSAENSEAICIEGKNSIHLFNSSLTGNMPESSQNDCSWNVILYQSMSGDSEVGNSTFEMNGGSLTAKKGGMFYTTNTQSTITLKDVDITNASDSDFFLRCTGNANQRGWGTTGSNGADCTFTGISQTMEGNVIWDSISQLDFYMTDGSKLTGAVTQDETYAGNGGSGYCNLYISSDSTWVVTGDSTVSKLMNAGKIVDANGKTVTIKGTDGTIYVQGTGSVTVTTGSYSTTADLSDASSATSWSDYKVAKYDSSSSGTTSGSDSSSSDNSGSDSSTSKTTVKATKVVSVTRKNKTMTVKLKKVSGASGYQICYATKKSCSGKTAKTVTVNGTKKTIKKLSAKKTYYVKARAYVTKSGKKTYSTWTKVKKVSAK